MRRMPEVLRNAVREIAVMPHSDHWGVWRSIARLAIDKYPFFAKWRDLDEAAVHVYERTRGGRPVVRQRVLKDEYDVWDIWILVRFLERRRVLQDDFLVVEETSEIFGRIGGTHLGYRYMIECVGCHTEEITPIKNKSSQNAMLASVGLGGPLEGMEDWDLVILN
ncbi:hypothetical protein QC761_0094100 [Podospora bellae-mahoneyi]|uniref:Uncharacterized protein n=1 Tax=Podospora bellae-mahoneyi TaxID=2093777 RepID=A0ABR0F9I1_9PEZI|nr:hypothetical protein QC761_0094100 [Podospora bellae-mahoneyi]